MGRRNNNKYKDDNDFSKDTKCQNGTETTTKPSAKRGKQNRNRNNSRDAKDKSNEIINNAAWYIKDPELRKQVASYNMNSTIGLPTMLHYNQMVPGLDHVPFKLNVPSVFAMECNPSPGFTPDPESGWLYKAAINKAARMIYSDISSVNAKTTQYQPQDLVFAILSLGEIISIVSHLTRIYGVAFNYSMRNRDLPDALLRGMRIDPNSVMNDLSGFRMKLNAILVTANQITMFSDIPYFEKCWDMYSTIYTDSLSTMSQIYMTVPYSTWVMNETAEGGTKLETRTLSKVDGGLLTAKDWLDILEEMVDTLLTSSTYNYIYTDILNYVSKKGGSLYSFGYVSEMYRVAPIYNLEYLLQVHNAVAYDVPVNNDVTQDVGTNAIKFSPKPVKATPVRFMDKVLDFPHTSNPSDDDKINAIMYHCAVSAGSNVEPGYFDVAAAALPDHYVVQFTTISGTDVMHTTGYPYVDDKVSYNKLVDTFTKFDWAPLIYSVDAGNTVGVIGDLNFYDVVPYDTIKETFDYCYLGLFTTNVKPN